jgi:hypothetical protein
MSQWILKANGNVVLRQTCPKMKTDEIHSEEEQAKRRVFDALIQRRWGTSINPPNIKWEQDQDDEFEEYEDDDKVARIIPEIEDMVDANGKLLNQHPAYDQIVNAEVSLQLGEEMKTGRVTK